jgi:vacuolar-type H+-ATPase subunit F/Vma7
MARIVYVGDEATAAGFRLAGVETVVPDAQDAAGTLRRAAADGAELILLSGAMAALVPLEELETALAREAPLLAIVPDVHGRGTPTDLAHDVRRALGIET